METFKKEMPGTTGKFESFHDLYSYTLSENINAENLCDKCLVDKVC